MKYNLILCFTLAFVLISCKYEVLPKPNAMLRLEYPETSYGHLSTEKLSFELNDLAKVKTKDNSSITLDYPMMKGSIFITYKKVEGNLRELMLDAEKLTYEHVVKADQIAPKEYINTENEVYGMFYEVTGNAASQSQFYVTDSTNHFVTGSLYFYAKPNYDSIYPAAIYLQKDIRRIMETLKWRD